MTEHNNGIARKKHWIGQDRGRCLLLLSMPASNQRHSRSGLIVPSHFSGSRMSIVDPSHHQRGRRGILRILAAFFASVQTRGPAARFRLVLAQTWHPSRSFAKLTTTNITSQESKQKATPKAQKAWTQAAGPGTWAQTLDSTMYATAQAQLLRHHDQWPTAALHVLLTTLTTC